MYREYVWIHECVHLIYDVYDEAECNRITDEIFLSRFKSDKDRLERIKFIARSNDTAKSNIVISGTALLIGSLVTAALGAGTKIGMSALGKRNSGYYTLADGEKAILVEEMLSESFTESLCTDKRSAKDIFWSKMQPYVARKNEQTYAGWYSNNSALMRPLISKYESLYGFGFCDITPVVSQDKNKVNAGIVAVVVSFVVLALAIYNNLKK